MSTFLYNMAGVSITRYGWRPSYQGGQSAQATAYWPLVRIYTSQRPDAQDQLFETPIELAISAKTSHSTFGPTSMTIAKFPSDPTPDALVFSITLLAASPMRAVAEKCLEDHTRFSCSRGLIGSFHCARAKQHEFQRTVRGISEIRARPEWQCRV
jgi:hypothetical protein